MTSLLALAAMAVIQPKWTQTFAQEFDGAKGTAPDPNIWRHDVGGSGYGNHEWESYTEGNKNAFLDGKGNLIIEARKEPTKGKDNIARDYSSARINTSGHFAQAYGKFEARIKMPRGKGIWPAFWMLGDNAGSVGWPRCGEIDITEFLGHQLFTTHGTVHGPGYSGGGGISAATDSKTPLDADYHVYGLIWNPEKIEFQLDGVTFQTVTPDDIGSNDWVYDHPHFIILNLAVGGDWPGYPDATTTFPQRMVVDWVRAYKDENLVVDTEGIKKRAEERKKKANTYTWPGPFAVPGTVSLADYNLGGEGKAYHDSDPENQGGQYRLTEGVDVGASGTKPKFSLGWTKAGEWLKYDLNISQTGTYKVEAMVASDGQGGEFHIEIDGEQVANSATVPNTGGWTNWKPLSLGDARLSEGKHTLKLVMDKNSDKTGSIGNFLSLNFKK